MATYTGTAQSKPSIGLAVWVAVVAFAIAAAVVLALVAFGGGSSRSVHPGAADAPATGFAGLENPGAYGTGNGTTGSHVTGSTGSNLIPLGNGICARCAP
jgi:hypothetical protein